MQTWAVARLTELTRDDPALERSEQMSRILLDGEEAWP